MHKLRTCLACNLLCPDILASRLGLSRVYDGFYEMFVWRVNGLLLFVKGRVGEYFHCVHFPGVFGDNIVS